MRILLCNDDGIEAPGMALLEQVASALSDDVWIVAPASNQSSCGRKITQATMVACRQDGERRYAVQGTPGDCAIIALNGLLAGHWPDVVLSGVNRGSNLGEDLMLSGTIGACLQAWEQGVPGIALSQALIDYRAKNTNWYSSSVYLEKTLRRLLPLLQQRPGVLNVNFPPLESGTALRGLRLVAAGRRLSPLKVTSATDDSGQHWFDYRSLRSRTEVTADSDIDLCYRGCITVTPLCSDLVDRAALSELQKSLQDNGTSQDPLSHESGGSGRQRASTDPR